MTRQYYYRTDRCQAKSSHDPECICWYDEKTGPYPEAREFPAVWESRGFQWREKPESGGTVIDVTRVKKTRGGQEVRIYALDGGNAHLIHGARLEPSVGWLAETWNKYGQHLQGLMKSLDLVEEPETVELDVWCNLYPHCVVAVWRDRETADRCAAPSRIACFNMKRTVTKGEGL